MQSFPYQMRVIVLICSLLYLTSANQLIDLTQFGETQEFSDFLNHTMLLFDELFTKRAYNKQIPPIWHSAENISTRLDVDVQLAYLKMFALDAENQLFCFTCDLKMIWRDRRLAWFPDEFGGVEKIFVNLNNVWLPDQQIGETKVLVPAHPEYVRQASITYEGIVAIYTVYYAEASCPINIDVFPFDHQSCPIQIMSWTQDYNHTMTNGSLHPSLSTSNAVSDWDQRGTKLGFQGNGEWAVTNITTYGYIIGNVYIMNFGVMLKRVPNFYVYVIAAPCFVLTILSVVGLFWSKNTETEQLTKLSIGFTSLISMTVLLDLLSSSIPKTSTFPLLGIYVIFCVGITSLACLLIIVFPLSKKAAKKEKEKEKLEKQEGKDLAWRKHLFRFVRDKLCQRHRVFQLFFQLLNLLAFIVFVSFWK